MMIIKQAAMVAMLIAIPFLPSRAATYANPVEGRLNSVYGDMITVEIASEVSKSPDANITNGELAFMVDSQTAYDGINALSDLKQGDRVSVEYKEDRNHKNIAVMIRKVAGKTTTIVVAPAPATTVTTTTVTSSP